MLTLRHWLLVMSGAGLFAGLPLSVASACDDDRFPCPIVAETPSQATASPARPARKKMNQSKHPGDKAQAKLEGSTRRGAASANAGKPDTRKQADGSISHHAAESVPATFGSSLSEHSANKESQNEIQLATAGKDWPGLLAADGEGARASGANGADATEAARANAVQLVNSKAVNELDQIAIARDSSWNTHLILVLGAALVAASGIWFLPRLVSPPTSRSSTCFPGWPTDAGAPLG